MNNNSKIIMLDIFMIIFLLIIYEFNCIIIPLKINVVLDDFSIHERYWTPFIKNEFGCNSHIISQTMRLLYLRFQAMAFQDRTGQCDF